MPNLASPPQGPKGYNPLSYCQEYIIDWKSAVNLQACASETDTRTTSTAVIPQPSDSVYSTTVILNFKHSTMMELKRQVMYILQKDVVGDWVSTTDCLCALIWVAVTRARSQYLRSASVTKFTTAVDARRRVSKPLPDYFGNLIVAATAEKTIEDLVGLQATQTLAGSATYVAECLPLILPSHC